MHKDKVLRLAKGFRGRAKNCVRIARQSVSRALQFAYRDRRQCKREFRSLWITRVNAAARQHGVRRQRGAGGDVARARAKQQPKSLASRDLTRAAAARLRLAPVLETHMEPPAPSSHRAERGRAKRLGARTLGPSVTHSRNLGVLGRRLPLPLTRAAGALDAARGSREGNTHLHRLLTSLPPIIETHR